MARRSLGASIVGIEKAKSAFKRKLWTQEYLATQVGIETRQPIWKFFTGKPIERHIFIEICFQLDLDWQEIADLPTNSPLTVKDRDRDTGWDIDALVQVVRRLRRDQIQAQCATMRLLDVAQPVDLEDIYVSVNILENITGQRWLDVFELQGFNPEEFDRFGLGQVCQERVPAMQAVATYSKLMVLGKPGCGKTTFLQHIAMQCNQGELLPDRVPIFIRLKNFAEDARVAGDFSLLNYISQDLGSVGAPDQLKTLLRHGRALILLDGLDEVQYDDSVEILKTIRKLSEEYYRNQLIITCRIAAQKYQFQGFTDIEIADFEQPQIEAFTQKWFVTVGRNSREKGKALATQFMQKLQLSENRQIRELGVTPLLLNLACSVFQSRSDFPARRSELYKQGLDILLIRWDEARSIKRDEIYRHLSLPHKIKLLSQIAVTTFEQGNYFFLQSNVQDYITDYLRNLPTAQTDPEVLHLNSEAVLKSLESQHGLLVERARGIYSFSHLTFHEYLTARNIVASPELQILEEKLLDLVSHLTELRWREVFLLTAGMLSNAAYLLQLMKQHIDALVSDEQLQQFFIWLNQKSRSVQADYKSAAIRAFYLTLVLPRDLTLARDLSLSLAIDPRLAGNLAPDLAIDLALNRLLSLSQHQPYDSVERVLALSFALTHDRDLVCDPRLQRQAKLSPLDESLQQLKEQLPAPDQGRERLKQWWNANGQTWTEKLKCLALRCRNIGHQWQFSDRQKEVLKQYYTAEHLLVDCLNSGCEVAPTVRKKIEETLLLPITRIADCASGEYGTNSYIPVATLTAMT